MITQQAAPGNLDVGVNQDFKIVMKRSFSTAGMQKKFVDSNGISS